MNNVRKITGNSNPHANLTPDMAEAERHLRALSGLLSVGSERFIFAAFHDREKDPPAWQRHCTLKDAWPDICRLQAEGYGIFVCVNASATGRRKKDDINGVRAVWLDLDGLMRGQFQLRPSLLIVTRTARGHAYWPTDANDPITPDECARLNRVIATEHGGDLGATDVARVLRLAGTWNLKYEPFPVRIVEATGQRYGRAELLAAYPLPTPPPKPRLILNRVQKEDRYVMAAVNGERDRLASAVEGTRNVTLNKSAFALGQLGLSPREIGNLLGPVALNIGLERSKSWATIQSGANAGARNPRQNGGRA